MGSENQYSRREILVAGSASLAGGVAGCLDEDDGGEVEDGPSDSGDTRSNDTQSGGSESDEENSTGSDEVLNAVAVENADGESIDSIALGEEAVEETDLYLDIDAESEAEWRIGLEYDEESEVVAEEVESMLETEGVVQESETVDIGGIIYDDVKTEIEDDLDLKLEIEVETDDQEEKITVPLEILEHGLDIERLEEESIERRMEAFEHVPQKIDYNTTFEDLESVKIIADHLGHDLVEEYRRDEFVWDDLYPETEEIRRINKIYRVSEIFSGQGASTFIQFEEVPEEVEGIRDQGGDAKSHAFPENDIILNYSEPLPEETEDLLEGERPSVTDETLPEFEDYSFMETEAFQEGILLGMSVSSPMPEAIPASGSLETNRGAEPSSVHIYKWNPESEKVDSVVWHYEDDGWEKDSVHQYEREFEEVIPRFDIAEEE